MPNPFIDDGIFAIDRKAEVVVYINGIQVASGLSTDAGNIKGCDIDFQIDQLPSTATINLVSIPSWIERDMDVWIDAGYSGSTPRQFTGAVKKRRHTPDGDVIDCVGSTAVLTRPYRVAAKSWTNTAADDVIEDILNDLNPPFTNYSLDASLSSLILGSAKTAVMDSMPPSDMIRKVADIDGHRVYETPSGALIIRPLLEAPAPNGFRAYGTNTAGGDETTDSTVSYSDSNIDAAGKIGDVTNDTARGQRFQVSANGRLVAVSVWLRKVGTPTDYIHFELRGTSSGLPTAQVLGGALDFPGSILTGAYQKVTFIFLTHSTVRTGNGYQLVISRTGAINGANHYEIGLDTSSPGYADGAASVFNGTTWSAVAGDTAFEAVVRTYPQLRILDIGDDEDEDQVKKKVYVKGAVIIGADAEGNATETQISAEALTYDDSLAVGDPELYAMTYQNDLIDTNEKASTVALRLLDRYHRILDTVEMTVPFDPRMSLGTTITLNDTEVTGKTGNWWVQGYRHSLAPGNAETSLSLFGGDQSGTGGLVAPQPDFTYVIERELIGNALQTVVTFTDQSYDFDGSIVNYQWQDDYSGGAMNISGPNKQVITKAYDPAVDSSITVTHTVTDDSGLTRAISKTISLSAATGEPMYVPLIAVAAGNTCMYSRDGAQTWVDRSTPSGEARVVELIFNTTLVDPPILLFGTTTGRIYRSADHNASLTLVLDAGSANPVVDIVKTPLVPAVVWVLTSTGLIYRSQDFGATWALYVNLKTFLPGVKRHSLEQLVGRTEAIDPTPCSKMLVSEPTVNRLWVMGGKGTDPATWFITHYIPDGPGVWTSDIVPGDGAAASTGNPAHTVIDAVVSHRTAGDLGLVFAGRNPPFIYADPNFYEVPTGWVDAIGLPAVDGRGVATNANQLQLFGFVANDKNFYRSQDGRNWETLTDVLPGTAGNRPHSLIQVGAWRDLFLCPTDEGLAKSIDYGLTWEFLRPKGAPWNTTWPVGAVGWEVAIDYMRPEEHDIMALVRDTSGNQTATVVRQKGSGWIKQSDTAGVSDGRQKLFRFPGMGNTVFRVRQSGGVNTWRTLQRSTNLGITWLDNTVDLCADITQSPDGTLWAVGGGGDAQPHRIYKSTDGGDNWTEVYNDTTVSGGQFTRYNRIRVDLTNANRIMVLGWRGAASNIVVLRSTDGGSNWTRSEPGASAEVTVMCLWAAQNGRFLLAFENVAGNDVFVYRSDDMGATWTLFVQYSTSSNEPAQNPMNAGFHQYFYKRIGSNVVNRTRDNGLTFESVAAPPNVNIITALAYDPRVDILYGGEGEIGNNVNVIYFMRAPSPTGVWQDLTENLATVTGYSRNEVTFEGLAFIGMD